MFSGLGQWNALFSLPRSEQKAGMRIYLTDKEKEKFIHIRELLIFILKTSGLGVDVVVADGSAGVAR